MPKNSKSKYKPAFKFLFSFIGKHKIWYLVPMVIALLLIGINLLQAYATERLIDNSIARESNKLIQDIVLFVVIVTANVALTWLKILSSGKLSALCIRDMKGFIARKLIDADYGETIKLKSGDMLNTLNTDTETVARFIGGNLIGLFSQFAMATGALIYLMKVHPILCLVTFAYTPIGLFFTMSINKKCNRLYPQNADCKGEALSIVEQTLSCIPIIKSFIMEKQIVKRVKAAYLKIYEKEMKLSILNALMQPACFSTSKIPGLTYLIFAGRLVMKGELSVGTFVAVYGLLEFIIGPSVYFPFLLNDLNRSIASINRIRKIEDLLQIEKKEIPYIETSEPWINVSNISFHYNENKPILQDVSFNIKDNGIVVLKGESGSGKTTLIDLISGLYSPKGGSIEICGINPSDSDIRNLLSIVSQEIYLFPISIKENIRQSKPIATDEDVQNAAKLVGAHEFISKLENGYETVIGDGNTGLSGGQKQRIALAQAILKDAPIWLLDEPTSALDVDTEAVVTNVIKKAAQNKIIIASSHRQSLIDEADRVINLDEKLEGKVCI